MLSIKSVSLVISKGAAIFLVYMIKIARIPPAFAYKVISLQNGWVVNIGQVLFEKNMVMDTDGWQLIAIRHMSDWGDLKIMLAVFCRCYTSNLDNISPLNKY